MFQDKLYEEVFNRHLRNGCNQLDIMGGWVGPVPLADLASTGLKCNVVYGCLQSGKVRREQHSAFLTTVQSASMVNLYYKQHYNHSKIYLWKQDGQPVDALVGSANFSASGLESDGQEVLFSVSDSTVLSQINDYVVAALADSKICDTSYNRFTGASSQPSKVKQNQRDKVISVTPPHAAISLVIKKNSTLQTHAAAGLNWGFESSGQLAPKRQASDAYIPIRKAIVSQLPTLFPNGGLNPNLKKGQGHRNAIAVAEAIFDDGETMKISFEGYDHTQMVKQLTSFPSKNILGKYLRRRLGVPEDKFVDLEHLNEYGRTNIEVSLLEEGIYYIDFSPTKPSP